MKTVLIEINDGLTEVIRGPKDVKVEIVDVNLLEEGDADGIQRYWKSLSTVGRNHVRRSHPETFEFVMSIRAEAEAHI